MIMVGRIFKRELAEDHGGVQVIWVETERCKRQWMKLIMEIKQTLLHI